MKYFRKENVHPIVVAAKDIGKLWIILEFSGNTVFHNKITIALPVSYSWSESTHTRAESSDGSQYWI